MHANTSMFRFKHHTIGTNTRIDVIKHSWIKCRDLTSWSPSSLVQHSWDEAPVLVLHPLLQQVGDDTLDLRFYVHVEIIRSLLISQDVLLVLGRNWLPELIVKPAWHFHIQTRKEHLVIDVLPAKVTILWNNSGAIYNIAIILSKTSKRKQFACAP